MTNTEINFRNIRSHAGSQNTAFEELCCQLAHITPPGEDWVFSRKGSGADAGIECFWKGSDGTEHGWQAKYVFDIDDLIKQVKNSVASAIEKHPNLKKYFICMPIDFADSRRDGHVTEKIKWDNAVQVWQEQAKDKGINIEFIPWGKFELTEMLSRVEPIYNGKRYYWFNEQVLTQEWFAKKCQDTIKDVGTRYTPDLSVSIPELPKIFEGLFRSDKFFAEIIEWENTLAKLIWHISIEKEKEGKYPELAQDITRCREILTNIKKAIANIQHDIAVSLDFSEVITFCDQLNQKTDEATNKIYAIEKQRYEAKRHKLADEGKAEKEIREALSRDEDREFNNIKHYLWRVASVARNIREYLAESKEALCARSGLLVIQGEAGQGKTHIISEIVEHRIRDAIPIIFMLGQHFSSTNDPWQQIFAYLGISTPPDRETFLSALDSLGEALNQKVLIAIDAINEGEGRKIWKDRLAGLINEIKRYQRICVVLSVRTNFMDTVFPTELRDTNNDVTHYIHKGFRGIEYQAVRVFFPKFGIKVPDTPLLSPEFSNPLFLKLFCSSLHDAGHTEVPKGLQGITSVFDFYVDTLNDKLSKNGEVYDPKARIVHQAINILAREMASQKNRWLKRETAKELLKNLNGDGQRLVDTLFGKLISEGLLIETYWYDDKNQKYDAIAFTYERFADHLVVRVLLDSVAGKNKSARALKGRIRKHPILKTFISGHDRFLFSGWIEALCIQIPERFGLEYFDLFPVLSPRKRGRIHDAIRYGKEYSLLYVRKILDHRVSRTAIFKLPPKHRQKVLRFINDDDYEQSQHREPFFNSIIWRETALVTKKTVDYLHAMPARYEDVLEMLLIVTSVPGHILNADRLHKIFARHHMPERDATFGRALTSSYMNEGAICRLIDCCWRQDTSNLDEDSARLCAIALCWSLSSPHRMLRDQSTKALVNLLRSRIDTLIAVMKMFESIDDLYVRERVFAAAYGICLLKPKTDELNKLAEYTYSSIFAENRPPHNVLLRDYAVGIIKFAEREGASSAAINMANVLPPYISEWPIDFPDEQEIETLFKDEENNTTESRSKNSIRWELNHGKFGRYETGKHSGCYWYEVPIGTKHIKNAAVVNAAIERLPAEEQAQCHQFIADLKNLVNPTGGRILSQFNTSKGEFYDLFHIIKEEDEGRQKACSEAISQLNDEFQEKIAQLRDALGNEAFLQAEKALYEYLVKEDSLAKLQDISTSKIKRWILKRVFDLGWSTERFGEMDYRHDSFREYTANERIGAKYTWLAMREIHCHLNDNLKFKRWSYDDDNDADYHGTWQTSERDIDPSFTGEKIPDYDYKTVPVCWWQPHHVNFENISEQERIEWVKSQYDWPALESLLSTNNPADNQPYLVLNAHYAWNERERFDDAGRDLPHRQMSLLIKSYLIHKSDLEKAVSAISAEWNKKNSNGYWMPHGDQYWNQVFLGEYPWAESCACYDTDWLKETDYDLKIPLIPTSLQCKPIFEQEAIKDSGVAMVPDPWLIKNIRLSWSRKNFNFVDSNGSIVTTSPNTYQNGPAALLIAKENLDSFLREKGLVLLWGVWANKVLIHEYNTQQWIGAYYTFDGEDITGESVTKSS